MSETDIVYLSPELAFPHFKKAPHISLMNHFETTLRTGQSTTNLNRREVVLKYYRNALREFKQSDKQTLSAYFQLAKPFLEKFAPKLIPSRLCFIKLAKGTEWDFPFTLEGCIVLSEYIIRKAKNALKNNDKAKMTTFTTTIVHELVHIHQKNNPRPYEVLYQRHYGMHKRRVMLSSALSEWIVTNPDGYNLEWVIPFNISGGGMTWFLPLLITDYQGNMNEVLVKLKSKPGHSEFFDDNAIIPAHAFPLYTSLFGVNKQLYHPHEITARILSEYIVESHIYTTPTLTDKYYSDLISLVNL